MQFIFTKMNTADSSSALEDFVSLMNTHAVPKYFSRVELEDGLSDSNGNYALIKFYVNDTLAMEFTERKATVTGAVRFVLENVDETIRVTAGVNMGCGTLITDNAIVFYPAASFNQTTVTYAFPLIICKTTTDQTMAISFIDPQNLAFTARTQGLVSTAYAGLTQHVFGERRILQDRCPWPSGPDKNVDDIVVATSIPTNHGFVAKDVYHTLNRSGYTIDYPFLFTQNGESYCGIAYNTYVIKTT